MTSPNFDSLPDEVILQILEYLPFEDQVRQSGINRRFYELSRTAITRRKTLIMDENLMNYITWNRPFGSLLRECSPIVVKIISTENISFWGPMVMEPIFQFFFPKLVEIEIKRNFDCPYNDARKFHESCFAMIEKCPTLKNFTLNVEVDLSEDVFLFRIPENVKTTNLEKLDICDCDEKSFESMMGVVPNLKVLNIAYVWSDADVFDNFFATTAVLEKVAVAHFEDEFDLAACTYFWRLPLKSFQLRFERQCDKNVSDQLIGKISNSFPYLESLALAKLRITDTGFRAIGSLRALRCLDLSSHRRPEMHDIGLLANCVELEKLRFHTDKNNFLLPWNFFITIIQSCQKLNTIECCGVVDLESEDAIIQILPTFANVKRRIKLGFRSSALMEIWKSDTVLAALEQLKENGGAEIEILDTYDLYDESIE